MFLDGITHYLNPQNPNRIADLSITDPFAIACFVLLAFMIPIALILLTITSRRSAQSVWATIEHERRYRRLRRATSLRASIGSVAAAASASRRSSQRSTRAMAGTPRRMAFPLPAISEAPTVQDRFETSATGGSLRSGTGPSAVIPHTPPSPDLPSPASTTFSEVYDRWYRGPQIEMEFEDPEGRKRWTAQLTELLSGRET